MTTDEFFLEKIKDGTLEVSKTGVVINLVTAKHIGIPHDICEASCKYTVRNPAN